MAEVIALPEVRRLIAAELLGEGSVLPVDDDTDLIEAGLCDSLSLVRQAAAFEERYPDLGITALPVDIDSFGSVARIYASLSALPAA